MIEFQRPDKAPPRFERLTEAAILRIGERAMDRYLARATEKTAKKVKPYSTPQTTRHVKSRSGKGVERLQDYDLRNTGDDIEGTIHLTQSMALQEFGGIIRANGRKYLAIPLPAALKPDGTPKRASPWRWRKARMIKSRKGHLVIALKHGRRLVPLYALKERVRVPARLGLRKTLKSERIGLRRDIKDQIKCALLGN